MTLNSIRFFSIFDHFYFSLLFPSFIIILLFYKMQVIQFNVIFSGKSHQDLSMHKFANTIPSFRIIYRHYRSFTHCQSLHFFKYFYSKKNVLKIVEIMQFYSLDYYLKSFLSFRIFVSFFFSFRKIIII